MTKIYTKTGDRGMTSLANGKKIKKTSPVIDLCGCLDELNSFLGLVVEFLCRNSEFNDLLKQHYRIQRELFELGVQISGGDKFVFSPQKITQLELEIDTMSDNLPLLKSFILPGGGEIASLLHIARAVCRRAERTAFFVIESHSSESAENVAIYLNRLGDWLFIAARYVAFISNIEEMVWKGDK